MSYLGPIWSRQLGVQCDRRRWPPTLPPSLAVGEKLFPWLCQNRIGTEGCHLPCWKPQENHGKGESNTHETRVLSASWEGSLTYLPDVFWLGDKGKLIHSSWLSSFWWWWAVNLLCLEALKAYGCSEGKMGDLHRTVSS